MNIIEFEVQHYSRRPDGKPRLSTKNAIVIHDTGGRTAQSALMWFANPASQVSSHYVIDKDGTIYRCVPDEYISWHAGRSVLHGDENVNSFSLGVELVDNNDKEPYPEAQLEALIELCTELAFNNKIPLNRVVGHQHICTPKGRKVDPGPDFPWYEFLNTLGAKIAEREFIE